MAVSNAPVASASQELVLETPGAVSTYLQKLQAFNLQYWQSATVRGDCSSSRHTLSRTEGRYHLAVRFSEHDMRGIADACVRLDVTKSGGEIVIDGHGLAGRPLVDLIVRVKGTREREIERLVEHAKSKGALPRIYDLRRIGADEAGGSLRPVDLSTGAHAVGGYQGLIGEVAVRVVKIHDPQKFFSQWYAVLTNSPDLPIAGAARHLSGADAKAVYKLMSAAHAAEHPRDFLTKIRDLYVEYVASSEEKLISAVTAYADTGERTDLDSVLGCVRNLRTQGKNPLKIAPALETMMHRVLESGDPDLRRIAAIILSSSTSPRTVELIGEVWNAAGPGLTAATMLACLNEIGQTAARAYDPELESVLDRTFHSLCDWLQEAGVEEHRAFLRSRASLMELSGSGELSQLLSGDVLELADKKTGVTRTNVRTLVSEHRSDPLS